MKLLSVLLIMAMITPHATHASVMSETAECKAKIHITEHMQHNSVAFKIIETNCDFLSLDTIYESSSVYSREGDAVITLNATLEGEVARGSSMGEHGAVLYAVFEHPSFTGRETLSFTFSY